MSVASLILWICASDEAVVLKVSVKVERPFVRLIDLVEAGPAWDRVRSRLEGVYLGRVPEGGRVRTVTVDAIRRQMEYMGIDAAGVRFSRECVLVMGPSGRMGCPPRASAAPAGAKPECVVRRRSVVRAAASSYEVDARALEDGAAGEEISLEYVSSGRRFRGRVVDAGRVEVVEVGR